MSLSNLEHASPLSNQAYRLIRAAIKNGELKPDVKITERSLAEKLDVSPTPIREALKRLEQEGLIERKGQKSLVVSNKTDMEIAELGYVKAALSGIAARFAAEKITEAELDEIMHLYDQFNEIGETASGEELLKLGRRFHEIIIHACRNDVLIQFLETLTVFDESHKTLSLNAEMRTKSSHLQQSILEHREIYEALKSREGERADKLMTEHFLRTSKIFFKHLNNKKKFG
jgi:DNA-binding GntR family transcriptional regulator